MRKHTRSKRIISLICALLMIIALLPMHEAKAAVTPYYYTCLDIGKDDQYGNDDHYVLNKADIGSVSARINSTVIVEGWVLSTVKFTSYTVYLSKGSNPPSKTIEADTGKYPFPSAFVTNFQKNTGKTYTTANSHWKANIPLTNFTTGTWNITVVGRVRGNANSTYDIAKIRLTVTSSNSNPNNSAGGNEVQNPVKSGCKQHEYVIEISNKHTNNPANCDDTVYVYRCKKCKEPYYDFYYRAYAAPEGTYNLPFIRHFMSNSGSNEYAKLNKGITCTSFELRDSNGNPNVYSKDCPEDKDVINGGANGDQTGNEWLLVGMNAKEEKGKLIVRADGGKELTKVIRYTNKDKELEKKERQTIARLCIDAAHNDHIGYDQGGNRSSYYNALSNAGWEPSKITSNCAADCASGVTANLIATGHLLNVESLKNLPANSKGETTYKSKNTTYYATILGNEEMNGEAFVVYTLNVDITVEDLLPGDILVFEKKGRHVAVNISFGKNVLDQWNK